jgi:hypothetical protein
MLVIPPITIGDLQLISSTVSEPDAGETAWDAATAYAIGDKAILVSTHRVYQRLVAGTTATSPDQDSENWSDIGATNKWAMFDLLRSAGTTGPTPLTVIIAPGQRVNALALVGLDADEVTIEMVSGGATVYSVTEDLNLREVTTWSDYFFEPFSFRQTMIRLDLPAFSGAQITVSISKAAGDVTCGGLIVGKSVELGETVQNPVSDVLNFSTIDRDIFGNAILVQRRNVPKTTQTAICDRAAVDKIRAVRDELNAVPAVWSWLDDETSDAFESGVICGVYKSFSITFDQPFTATIQLEIEEV